MFIYPMLLHKIDQPFDDNNFLTELKLDGIRLIYSYIDDKKLYTRHNNEVTNLFPELLSIDIPKGTVLDGELIVTDEYGRPDIEELMRRFKSTKSNTPLQYCVFDIIYHNGDRVKLPLIERKQLLESIIPPDQSIILSTKWTIGNAIAYFDLCKQHDLEGAVIKRVNSAYQVNKRSYDWLKIINYKYENVVITGFRKNEFGLLLGVKQDNVINNVGLMKYVPLQARKDFYGKYRRYASSENKDFIFLDPGLKCKVKFRNWTKAGKLRIPSFVEWVS